MAIESIEQKKEYPVLTDEDEYILILNPKYDEETNMIDVKLHINQIRPENAELFKDCAAELVDLI